MRQSDGCFLQLASALALLGCLALPACEKRCRSDHALINGRCVPPTQASAAEAARADAAVDASMQASPVGPGSLGTSGNNPGVSVGGTGGGWTGAAQAAGSNGATGVTGDSGASGSSNPQNGKPAANSSADGTGAQPMVVCGDGVREGDELCDGADCPTACEATSACVSATLVGSSGTCDAHCEMMEITECASGDGCCAKGCDYSNDTDCSPTCGDGVVSNAEKCEANSSETPCPAVADCDDGDECTMDVVVGTAAQCSAECAHMPIAVPAAGDGCCPPGASEGNDPDCPTVCGDGVVTANETCDPRSNRPCPTTCNDRVDCTKDELEGDAQSCTSSCSNTPITRAANGDGCCPNGLTLAQDNDCEPRCGDGVVSAGERCEDNATGSSRCPGPSDCDDNNACTMDRRVGSACNYQCDHDDMSSPEDCDGRDDDCDGRVDEQSTCSGAQICKDGRCQAPPPPDPWTRCTGSSSCQGGYICNLGLCVPSCSSGAECPQKPNSFEGEVQCGGAIGAGNGCVLMCGNTPVSPEDASTWGCPGGTTCKAAGTFFVCRT